ncbi:hypothetical protein [Campylobacter sp. RM16704]|uniref:hypothetical protein n=1 Tax=Campylobacter sp. RM16704 TaxID=1500960 RepID=UPI00068EE8D8|nr:hypothetical protein [Campylobacter sp. RM16704]
MQNDLKETFQTCCSKNTNYQNNKTNLIFIKNPKNTIKAFNFKTQAKKNKIKEIFFQSFKEYKKILPYIIIGMGIGAFIHGLFPQIFLKLI